MTWPLDDVILIKQRQRGQVSPEKPCKSATILPIPRPSNAPSEIEMLVKDQIDEITKVPTHHVHNNTHQGDGGGQGDGNAEG